MSFVPGVGSGQSAGSAPNVARVSFVQGSVQLLAGQGTDFAQAVINMPVLDGSRLQTGEDGQVEVEFGDGSVARLTPNSSLQFGHRDRIKCRCSSCLAWVITSSMWRGHPPFDVQFATVDLAPTANSILRIGLDAGWEVAVITGSAHVQGNGIAAVDVAENQSIRAVDNNGAPYTVAQGINGDSWDNWNQDRDQAIAQEAAQQTPVRDDSSNPQNENWNDLDASGNWYPVEGAGNVWVPAAWARAGIRWGRLLGLLPDLRLHLGVKLPLGLAALSLRRLVLLRVWLGLGSWRVWRLASGNRGANVSSGLENAGAPGLCWWRPPSASRAKAGGGRSRGGGQRSMGV